MRRLLTALTLTFLFATACVPYRIDSAFVYISTEHSAEYGDTTTPRVALFGDSILYQSRPALRPALWAAGYAEYITAWPTKTTRWGVEQAQIDLPASNGPSGYSYSVAESRPDIVVLQQGTNDWRCLHLTLWPHPHQSCDYEGIPWAPDLAELYGWIDQMVALFPNSCVVVVTDVAPRDNEAEYYDHIPDGEIIGPWISDYKAGHADVIVDWRGAATPADTYDHVGHLTATGQANMAAAIVAGVQACP